MHNSKSIISQIFKLLNIQFQKEKLSLAEIVKPPHTVHAHQPPHADFPPLQWFFQVGLKAELVQNEQEWQEADKV